MQFAKQNLIPGQWCFDKTGNRNYKISKSLIFVNFFETNIPYDFSQHCSVLVFFAFLHIRLHAFYTDVISSEQPSYLEIMPCWLSNQDLTIRSTF